MNLEKEIWKPVDGFNGKYEVSSTGRLRSFDSEMPNPLTVDGISIKKGQMLNPWDVNGYRRVCLSVEGKQKHRFVHRLVAAAFLPLIKNKPYVNHIDGNRCNNRLSNLEWCSQKENVNHAKHVLNRVGENKKLVLNTLNGVYYTSGKEAYIASGSSHGVIHFRHLIKSNQSHLIYC